MEYIRGESIGSSLTSPCGEVDWPLLFFLQRNQIVAEVLDSFLNGGLIVIVHVLEDSAPGGHVGRTVRGDAGAEAENVGDQVVGEFAAVALGKCGEIGGGNLERGSSRAVSLGIEAVAGGAVLLEHFFARGHEVGRDLVLAGRRLGLGGRAACKDQHCGEQN